MLIGADENRGAPNFDFTSSYDGVTQAKDDAKEKSI